MTRSRLSRVKIAKKLDKEHKWPNRQQVPDVSLRRPGRSWGHKSWVKGDDSFMRTALDGEACEMR
eukprot:5544736-Amphidinium_carterae.1